MGAVRNLLYNLVRRDLTVRYKSTVLGFFWSFVKPLILAAIFYLAFGKILFGGIPTPDPRVPFALHLLTGVLLWTCFGGATSEAMTAILANANLIKKVKLPLGVFPLATVTAHFVHFLLALLVLLVLLILKGLTPGVALVLIVPVLALQFILTLAIAFFLAALNVFYRDVGSLWEVLTTAWFYATPIVYPYSLAADKFHQWGYGWLEWLYLANPLTPLALAYRRLLLYEPLDAPVQLELSDTRLWGALGLCVLVTAILFWSGWRVFQRYSKSFADEL